MKFILTLGLATIIIIFLTVKIWKKTKSFSFILGLFFLFYWSLAGSWIFYFDFLSGFNGAEIGLHYYYFFEKLFLVEVNNDFLLSIVLYSCFIILVQISVLISYKGNPLQKVQPITVKLNRLVFIMLFCLSISLLLIRKELYYAFENNLILYNTVELSTNRFLTFHQLTFQLAITALMLAISIFFSKEGKKIIMDKHNLNIQVLLLICFGLIVFLINVLGNKKELLFAGMLAILFFISNNQINKKSLKKLTVIAFAVIVPLLTTDIVRAMKFRSILTLDIFQDKATPKKSSQHILGMILFSNELFFANFSMYGVLQKEIPPSPGISIKYLAHSLIPRVIEPDRPEDVYSYYARKVNAVEGQGYTIHHATAWLLNFGMIGVFLGAILFGFIWGRLTGLQLRSKENTFKWIIVFLVPSIICAYIPVLVRNGIEGYKAFLIEGVLLTCLIIYFSDNKFSLKKLPWKK